ncbi:hypothetical protein CROQUDRAFT_90150 [Cronartium quercuum f. sp. fusiforme G11]|uniref:Uncharacterized protein n=1 Tax=Cronartium quercuum f. sp. fusiforme G11 TaxID=708437 RepID=A0A9P6NQU2_9BASI|nr:hypothetical protein CROQUDRAFT_90150 [Cronartium quercuum f. sp. fusiforme G11]
MVSNSNAAPSNSKKQPIEKTTQPYSGSRCPSQSSTKKKATVKSAINTPPKTPFNQRARSATPSTPGSGSKKNPLQMIMKDQPAGFERTKHAE